MNLQGVVTPTDSVQTPATGVKNWVKQSKPKIWKVKRSKAHRKLEKVKGQAQLKVNRIQNLIKARYHMHLVEQIRSRVKGLFEWRSRPKIERSKILTAVAGVSTESSGVTSP